MKPPSLKVAMIWGRDSLRLRCEASATLVSTTERRAIPAGELTFRIISSRPAARHQWLWLGQVREDDLSGIMAEAIGAGDWTTGLWPVGMNPVAGEWRVRDHRLLARPNEAGLSPEELRVRLAQIQPDMQSEIVELPEGQASGQIILGAEGQEFALVLPVTLESTGKITAPEAPVGEGFHWGHTEALELPAPAWIALGTDGQLCAGVELEVEDYLASVNSSEMPADSPLEFLKSQVVAARSWLLANWGSHHPGEPYTICNGDHCQCYYGQGRIREASRCAAGETSGQVLMHQQRIADARYAKACGGVMEPAANVWAFADQPYLGHFADLPAAEAPDLSDESDFREYQRRNRPEDACCSPGYAPLQGRLKELSGLYRWQEQTTLSELAQILQIKTGVDVGVIQDLKPVRRGPSGRLIELEVTGSGENITLSPELAIRRALSRTHLPSSAFWIQRESGSLTLHGLGWGHGVGLCQIGAAALAANGWDYRRILAHYYRGTELEKVY